ncbi:DUF7793 family protein [Pontibacter mangrovi]|uniref:DUF7793 domain-containing protein n=1 Tax=Pontibacter mangrovi TaxID=2589816 RepID=A0A501W8H0_9BACT|nr:hypothetical protein [Pontibacter mangrovi]TPE44334.1 hypothetical protein FJM65_09285 [Pontibacter mangrovi]
MAKFDKNYETKSKSTDYVTMKVHDGIFYMYYKPLRLLDIHIAKAIVKERLAFKEGVPYPSLFDIQRVEHSTKEARDYMADKGNDLVQASAIMVSSPMLRMMANFYIMVNRPKNPTRMFTDEKSAVEWLTQFREK